MAKTVGSENELTFTEWHAFVLGVCVGLVAIWLRSVGSTRAGTSLVAVFAFVALGFTVREKASAGQRTIRREPWYALAGLVLGGGAALAAATYLP